jgi:hypothetical protein
MLSSIRKILRQIESFLQEFYDRTPGCCASGGLSVAELNGKRKSQDRKVS